MKKLALAALFGLLFLSDLAAQSFGRNKPHYQKTDFKVNETEHFEIYESLNNPEKTRELAAAAEMWYRMHQAVLRDTFKERNPMVIYNEHAGFQETNTIQGDISVGTGGVTEGLRNRVIFPVAMTNQQTNHVLGHELVHAFQYHMVINGDSTSLRNLENLPLWMVEGLAEYLSIGRIDAHTALWMRDAVLNDDLPTLKNLNNFKYFPYRWGQAFWAFVAGVYGDEMIPVLFMNTAKYGLDRALEMNLGIKQKELSEAWHTALRNHYGKWVAKGQKEDPPGRKLMDDKNAGELNICPVLSPNGKYIIFLSEKNLLTTDLFLANVQTGKIIKKVVSTARDGHIDALNFIESAGTWSPDSKRFAFDVYQGGRSVLVIQDISKRKNVKKMAIPGVPAFANPVWSPDGNTIVVSGLVNGQTDLFEFNLKTKKVRQLTNDKFSEILPTFSADGKKLAFSTDEISMKRTRTNGVWTMNLAVMDVVSGKIDHLDVFPGADNLNPQFDKNGNLLFLSNRDGLRNLYRFEFSGNKVFQMTDLKTGITGITPFAPAISVADDRDRIVYTYFFNREYKIYTGRAENFLNKEITNTTETDFLAATLPPFDPRKKDIVNANLRMMDLKFKETANTQITEKPYKSKFKLEYAGGSTGVGVATGNNGFNSGTGMAGGVDLLFGDILGNNQLYTGLALNGEFTDAAGIFSYINRKNRIGWGASISHIPQRFVSGFYLDDQPNYYQFGNDSILLYEDQVDLTRIFQERLAAFAFYPISTTRRIEGGISGEYYYDRIDRYKTYYTLTGVPFATDREKIPSPGTLRLASLNVAYVGDNSYFGGTAPLQGWRYHLGAEQYFGDFHFPAVFLDGRRYFYAKPFSFAVRGLTYSRFGGNHREVYPLSAFHPFLVRGFQRAVTESPTLASQTRGSKLLVGNFEIRLPFTGPRRLALIPLNFLPTDLNFFVDAGAAFYDFKDLKNGENGRQASKAIVSAGVSLRVNVLGALIVEPFYALPISLKKDDRQWVFGFNLIPGW